MNVVLNPIILLASIAIGILLEHSFSFGAQLIAVLMGSAVIVYASLRYLTRTPANAIRLNLLHYVWIALLSIALGATSEYFSAVRYPVEGTHHLVSQKARIIDDVAKNAGDLLTVELLDCGCKATILTRPCSFGVGDIILIDGQLLPVDPDRASNRRHYRRNAKQAKNSEKRDSNSGFVDYQLRQGILYSGVVPIDKIRKIGHSDNLRSFANTLRDRLESGILKTGLSTETKNFLITLFLGDRQFLDPELRQTFSDLGLSHVLAVSGLHTGIIASILLALFLPFNIIGRRKWKFGLSIILIWVFVIVTGLAPSTVRAAIMMTCLFIGMMIERKMSAGTALCWAAVFILILSPSSLFDVGFQLSFLCVASLTIFCEKLNPFDISTHRRLYLCASAMLATIVSTGCTWIVVAYYFGTLPTMFLPANLIILPFVPVYMGLALVYFLLFSFGVEARGLGHLLDSMLEITDKLGRMLSADGSTVLSVNPGPTSVGLWLVGILFIGYALYTQRKSLIPAIAGSGCMILSIVLL